MKSYTDLEQSKKLAEILPIESADMFYSSYNVGIKRYYENIPRDVQVNNHFTFFNYDIPCWSLAALLDVLPYPSLHKTYRSWRCDTYNEEGDVQKIGEDADNPVDACYEMIIKLHELKIMTQYNTK